MQVEDTHWKGGIPTSMVQRIAAAFLLLALAVNAQYASYNPATSAANTVSGLTSLLLRLGAGQVVFKERTLPSEGSRGGL